MIGLERIQRWWTQRLLHRHRIPIMIWKRVLDASALVSQLQKSDRHRLRELASLFLHRKAIVGADGLELDEVMRAFIAAEASLLVLNLGLDWYDGWSEIIVYPGAFIAPHRERDEAGVVHEVSRGLSGEAWARGPVVLSWADIDPSTRAQRRKGSNVLLHEFAHKLDFLDGAANGIPPLHVGNTQQEWARDFTRAYANLNSRTQHELNGIDHYATTNPAEFFAVMTELFFEQPKQLHKNYAPIYEELSRFYKQSPLKSC